MNFLCFNILYKSTSFQAYKLSVIEINLSGRNVPQQLVHSFHHQIFIFHVVKDEVNVMATFNILIVKLLN